MPNTRTRGTQRRRIRLPNPALTAARAVLPLRTAHARYRYPAPATTRSITLALPAPPPPPPHLHGTTRPAARASYATFRPACRISCRDAFLPADDWTFRPTITNRRWTVVYYSLPPLRLPTFLAAAFSPRDVPLPQYLCHYRYLPRCVLLLPHFRRATGDARRAASPHPTCHPSSCMFASDLPMPRHRCSAYATRLRQRAVDTTASACLPPACPPPSRLPAITHLHTATAFPGRACYRRAPGSRACCRHTCGAHYVTHTLFPHQPATHVLAHSHCLYCLPLLPLRAFTCYSSSLLSISPDSVDLARIQTRGRLFDVSPSLAYHRTHAYTPHRHNALPYRHISRVVHARGPTLRLPTHAARHRARLTYLLATCHLHPRIPHDLRAFTRDAPLYRGRAYLHYLPHLTCHLPFTYCLPPPLHQRLHSALRVCWLARAVAGSCLMTAYVVLTAHGYRTASFRCCCRCVPLLPRCVATARLARLHTLAATPHRWRRLACPLPSGIHTRPITLPHAAPTASTTCQLGCHRAHHAPTTAALPGAARYLPTQRPTHTPTHTPRCRTAGRCCAARTLLPTHTATAHTAYHTYLTAFRTIG